MNFEIRVSHEPARYLRRLNTRSQGRFLEKFEQLAANPPEQSKQLSGLGGARSARLAGWRIIFSIDFEAGIITVDHIAPRGQVYRNL